MTSEKLRLRTDEELDNQRKGLMELADALDEVKVPYYLCSGTLLGAVREQNFIRWDWDVQFYLRTEDVYDRREELMALFESKDFTIQKFNPKFNDLKYSLYKYGATYELTAWHEKNGMRYRKDYQLPGKFFEGRAAVQFLGRTYRCMNPPEGYLEYCYGDWRTPRRDADKESYHHPRFFRYKGWKKKMYRLNKALDSKVKGILGADQRK